MNVKIPLVHPAVNIAGTLLSLFGTLITVVLSNQQLVIGLFPARDAAIVASVTGLLATLWPDSGAHGAASTGITPSEIQSSLLRYQSGSVSAEKSMNTSETLILLALQAFAGSNPTVQLIEEFLPQLTSAVSASKAGQAFSVSVPAKVDGVPGKVTIGFNPGA